MKKKKTNQVDLFDQPQNKEEMSNTNEFSKEQQEQIDKVKKLSESLKFESTGSYSRRRENGNQ